MTKRVSTNGKGPSSSKKPKQEASDSENESDTDIGDETTSSFNFPPDKLSALVKSFQSFVDQHDVSLHNLEKYVTEWAELEHGKTGEIIDITMFANDFRAMLRSALKVKTLKIADAALIVGKHLETEKVLDLFTDFPKRPPQLVQLHIKNNNLAKGIKDISAAYESLKAQPESYQKEINQEHLELEKKYKTALEEFLDNHPSLTETQKKNVTTRIKTSTKKVEPKTPGTSGPKRKKKEPETAFSLWSKTKADKYRDLSEEDREKKLQKKFSKLSESEVKLLEDLVMAQ